MTTQTPNAPALEAVHYEVESELNPRYAETGDLSDCYGVYSVVKWQGDTRMEVVETYRAYMLDARRMAYSRAGRLNTEAPRP